jgi:hypothetical protein
VVESIGPNQINLRNVNTGGKGSSSIRKMTIHLRAEDAPGKRCNGNKTSAPTPVNLRMVDDDGDPLIDSPKVAVCKARDNREPTTVRRDVLYQPLNCANSEEPPHPHSNSEIKATVSIPGQPDYTQDIGIKCSP